MRETLRRWGVGFGASVVVSVLFFRSILLREGVLVHGDYRYALTTEAHFGYHLSDLHVHAPKLPFLALLRLYDLFLGEYAAQDLFTVSVFVISCLVLFVTATYFLRRILPGKSESHLTALAVLSVAVFAWNPWTINKIHHHYWMVLSLASAFAAMMYYDRVLFDRYEKWHVLPFAFAVLAVGTQPQSGVLYLGIPVLLYTVFWAVVRKGTFVRRLVQPDVLAVGAVVLLLNVFWMFVYLRTITSGATASLSSYGIVVENVGTLSQRGTLANAFSLSSRFVWGGEGALATGYDPVLVAGINLWRVVSVLPAAFAVVPLLFVRRFTDRQQRGYVALFSVLMTVYLLLATGSYYGGFGELYEWVFLNAPLGNLIRDPYKNVGVIVVAFSVLVPVSASVVGDLLAEVVNARPSVSTGSVVVALLIVSAGFGYPALTGDVNGHLTASHHDPPDDLATVVDQLPDDGQGNVLWYPPDHPQYRDVPQLSTHERSVAFGGGYQRLLDSAIENRNRRIVSEILRVRNVEHVVVQATGTNDAGADFEEMFPDADTDTVGSFTVFDLDTAGSTIGASSHKTVGYSADNRRALRFPATVHGGAPGVDSAYVVTNESLNDTVEGAITVRPRSRHFDPQRYWSQADYDGGWLSTVSYEGKGMENTQTYYRQGVVFTWSETHVRDVPPSATPPTVAEWTFDDGEGVDAWKDATPRRLHGAVQTVDAEDGTLRASLRNSTWGWKIVRSPRIDVSNRSAYRISYQRRANDVYGLHLKVASYNDRGEVIDRETVRRNPPSITSEWETVRENYVVENESTEYVRLEYWHGHNTTHPLPNEVYLDDVRVQNVTEYLERPTLRTQFTVDEEGDYRVFGRYFANEKGGQMRVRLDGEPVTVDTKSPQNDYVWKDLATRHLEPGTHTLVLKNVRGFNAVNRFTLVREGEYRQYRARLDRQLQDRTVVHLLEAETDMRLDGATTHDRTSASGGGVVTMNATGDATGTVDTIKSGRYRLAVRGDGAFTVRVDDRVREVRANGTGYAYTEPVRLERGTHDVVVSPAGEENATLDAVWLYSTPRRTDVGERTVEEAIPDANQSDIVRSVERVSPTEYGVFPATRYEVRVDASSPYMLSMAKGYNPLWVAEVPTDGATERVVPTALYGLVNGYWIEETGEYAVTLRYRPLEWFYQGAVVSGLTLVALLGYLAYDRRRRRG